jgi:dTDP-4-amino-4,6-dideoxygalactose transaminase
MDPDLLEEELEARARRNDRPAAVIAVDLYGQCADYDRIVPVCDAFDVPLIEDAAEALGATCGGRPAGSFGRAAAFSFNGNKIITTSSGGMLVSHDKALIDQARYLSTQAREPVVHYEHVEVGFNYRLSNLLAAIGRGQLSELASKVERRRRVFDRYRDALGALAGVSFMPMAGYGAPNCWLTCVVIDPALAGVTREDVRRHLETLNVESRPVWKPMHLQPIFKDCFVRDRGVAAGLFRNGLCLPSGSGMTDADQQRVIEGILAFCGERSRTCSGPA